MCPLRVVVRKHQSASEAISALRYRMAPAGVWSMRRAASWPCALVPFTISTMTYKGGKYPPFVAPLRSREGIPCRENARIESTYLRQSEIAWKLRRADIRHRIETSFAPRSCCMRPRGSTTMPSPRAWIHHGRLSASGASASSENGCGVLRSGPALGARRSFPPSLVVAIKALACQLPYESDVPLSRWSVPEIRREVIERGPGGLDR